MCKKWFTDEQYFGPLQGGEWRKEDEIFVDNLG
jgi:hypothetical protein